jgi:hypothetical protein
MGGVVLALLGSLAGWAANGGERAPAAYEARCAAAAQREAPALLKLARSSDTPAEVRARAVDALGWLQQAESVPALLELARTGPALGEHVARALRFFGARSAFEAEPSVGGHVRTVVFPPRPDPAATRALLELAAEPKLAHEALWALKFHDATPKQLMAIAHADQYAEDLLPLLQDDGEALLKLLTAPSPARPRIAEAVGYSARADAVAPLYGLLGSASAELRAAALAALHHLAGKQAPFTGAPEPDVGRAIAHALFGPKLERFDAHVALRRDPERQEPAPVFECAP